MADVERHESTEHWRKANAHHHRTNRHGKAMLLEVKASGEHLLQLKQDCKHGSWEAEVEDCFKGSYRTAAMYMWVVKNWEEMAPYLQHAAFLGLVVSLRGFERYHKGLGSSNRHAQPTSEEPPKVEHELGNGGPNFVEDDPYEKHDPKFDYVDSVTDYINDHTSDGPDEPSPEDHAPDNKPLVSGAAHRRASRPTDASEPRHKEPAGAPRDSPFDIELNFIVHTIEYLEVLLTDTNEENKERLKKIIVGLTRALDTLRRYSPTQINIALPAWVDPERWDQFVVLRGAKGKPVTASGARLMLDRLRGFRDGGHDPNEILDQTVREGWQGVFPIRENQNGEERGTDNEDSDRYRKYEGLIQGS